MSGFQHLAVLTSGGDAPGQNAAIRAVVRQAAECGIAVFGIEDGYAGLLDTSDERIRLLSTDDVTGYMSRAGTLLGTARERRMYEPEAIETAILNLTERDIHHLIVIGGNGSQSGALALSEAAKGHLNVLGIASTIDNDLAGTDTSIGVDTAVQTAVNALDCLRETASSHRRVIVVEVMGRKSGYLAVQAALAGGAERVVVPEIHDTYGAIEEDVRQQLENKRHYLIVVAEGAELTARSISETLALRGFDTRLMVLGHIQRGAPPTASDRKLASILGETAVRELTYGMHQVVVGWTGGHPVKIPMWQAVRPPTFPKVSLYDVRLVGILGR